MATSIGSARRGSITSALATSPLPCRACRGRRMAEYEAAHAAYAAPDTAPLGVSRTMAGSLDAGLIRYYESRTFKELAPGTQEMRRNLLERWRVDHGKLPLRPLRSKHIQAYISKLESKAAQPNTLTTIRHFTKFALDAALVDEDPASSVTRARLAKTGGFKTWSEEDLAQFEATYPIGAKPRLAMALMLYFGVRRSDVVRIGPQHIRGGVLHEYLPKKGEHTGGNLINVPVHPELAKIIAATPVTGTRTFLGPRSASRSRPRVSATGCATMRFGVGRGRGGRAIFADETTGRTV